MLMDEPKSVKERIKRRWASSCVHAKIVMDDRTFTLDFRRSPLLFNVLILFLLLLTNMDHCLQIRLLTATTRLSSSLSTVIRDDGVMMLGEGACERYAMREVFVVL